MAAVFTENGSIEKHSLKNFTTELKRDEPVCCLKLATGSGKAYGHITRLNNKLVL